MSTCDTLKTLFPVLTTINLIASCYGNRRDKLVRRLTLPTATAQKNTTRNKFCLEGVLPNRKYGVLVVYFSG